MDEVPLPLDVPGRLFATGLTHLGDDPAAALGEVSADVLVSLVEDRDLALRFGRSAGWFESVTGMHVLRLPTPDYGVADDAAVVALVGAVEGALRHGDTTVVHCAGGIGRTGVLCTLVLVALGVAAGDAAAAVRSARLGAGAESPAQHGQLQRLAPRVSRPGWEALPVGVQAAFQRARTLGFRQSCHPAVGHLLALLAGGVADGGRILEIGTGAGVGTAWLALGVGAALGGVEIVTVDARGIEGAVPAGVRGIVGDARVVVPELIAAGSRFDLVFADAAPGKTERLDLSVDALAPGGMLVMDDMAPPPWHPPGEQHANAAVLAALRGDERLLVEELAHGSGVALARRSLDQA